MTDYDDAQLMVTLRELKREWIELLQRAGAIEDRMLEVYSQIPNTLRGLVSLPHPLLGGTRFTDLFTETEPEIVEGHVVDADPVLLPEGAVYRGTE